MAPSASFIIIIRISLVLLTIPNSLDHLANGCYFKAAKVAQPGTLESIPVNLKNYTRLESKTRRYVCGWNNAALPLFNSWAAFIHFQPDPSKTRTCPGTIINSNMIITSHKCLQKKDRINLFDVWKTSRSQPNHSTLADPTDVLVQVGLMGFTPKKIIYSERYAYDSIHGMTASDFDVAILVMDNEFTAHYDQELFPICLPMYGEIQTDKLINVVGYYQGIRSWDFYPEKLPIGLHNFTTIQRAEDCKQLGKLNVEPPSRDTLCMRFKQPGPTTAGGPLRINSRYIDGITQRSFLVGLATWVESDLEADARHKYAYFANINYFVKYIERHALIHKSEWCITPKFNSDDEDWPWEEKKTFTPDQSLDCDCGTKTPTNKGRISGGEAAVPREFPWMTKLSVFKRTGTDGKTNSSSLCAGTVISDRIIMTAAHCFFNPDKKSIYDDEHVLQFPYDLKAYIVNINSHLFENDDKEFHAPLKHIYIHPGYSRSKFTSGDGNFDIALAVLETPLDLQAFPPVCLPRTGTLDEVLRKKVNGTVAGWGITNLDDPDSFPTELQKIELPIHSIFNCTVMGYENPVGTKLCVGNFGKTESTQPGDSGGPLMVRNNEGRMTQLGIVSYFLNETDAEGKPVPNGGIITYQVNVEAFLPYINFYSERHKAKGCRVPKDLV